MRARGGANDAVRALLDLAPPKAVVLRVTGAVGRSSRTERRGIPLRRWTPNRRPTAWTCRARGAKPRPPAADGKQAGTLAMVGKGGGGRVSVVQLPRSFQVREITHDGEQFFLTDARGRTAHGTPDQFTAWLKLLDEEVARLHLAKVGAKLSKLSKAQSEYLGVEAAGPFKPDYYRY